MEVLLQRSAHDGAVAVGGESTGQHRHVSKGRFQRLVENVTDLVLEVLGSDQRIEEVLPALTQHGVDFTASTTKVLVVVESLPTEQAVTWAGLGTGIEQNADFWVQDATNGSEKPSMRVDLLCVLLLQAEHHLHRGKRAGAVVMGRISCWLGVTDNWVVYSNY